MNIESNIKNKIISEIYFLFKSLELDFNMDNLKLLFKTFNKNIFLETELNFFLELFKNINLEKILLENDENKNKIVKDNNSENKEIKEEVKEENESINFDLF